MSALKISRYLALLVALAVLSNSFVPSSSSKRPTAASTQLEATMKPGHIAASAVLISSMIFGPSAFADEIGVEKDAPTLFTGETVMICTKRGPLGACTKSELRTVENDNDKAKQYFRDPADIIKAKEERMKALELETEGNSLIDRLRQQTEDNKERNRLSVEVKTFQNDQGANFGPFNGETVILNTDGKTFTLLENPQAMRLKKQGFIEGRKFVKQPTQAEIEAALETMDDEGGLAGAILGALGQKSSE